MAVRRYPGSRLSCPSTVTEFVRQAGTTNEEGLVDRGYREVWIFIGTVPYSKAISKLEEVSAFPQHSEVGRLIRDSQQANRGGQGEKRLFSTLGLVVVGGGALLFLLVAGSGAVFLLMLMRKKPKPTEPFPASAPAQRQATPASHSQAAPAHAQSRPPYADSSKTVRAPAFQAIPATPPADRTAGLELGSITCTSGELDGQRFEITREGIFIGRDRSVSQVVIQDERISKRHV